MPENFTIPTNTAIIKKRGIIGMEFLYLLEKIRMPGLNEFFLAITTLGEETAFLVIGLIIFWCVGKRQGYYVMTVGLAGTVASQLMKIIYRVPRPWVLDSNFTILEQAREAAGGYSFPSGHTQSAVGTFGAIATFARKKWFAAVCILLAVLVGLSRMYIGVHTPADVLVGAALSVVFIGLFYPMMMGKKDRTFFALILLAAMSLIYLAYMEFTAFPADIDAHNLESAMKNAYTLLGCSTAFLIVYPLEKRHISFSEKAVWWAQLLKVLLGLVVVLAVKEGLRRPLEALFAGHLIARAVRYFLIVIVAGLVWPLTFRFFGKLGNKK